MSPEAKNASPRLTSATISAAEEWSSAGGWATSVPGLPTIVGLTGGGDSDLVSVFGATCIASEFVSASSGARGTDPSPLIGLPSPVLSELWRSARGYATTVAGLCVTAELTGEGEVVADADL